jgi:hypothetical protein
MGDEIGTALRELSEVLGHPAFEFADGMEASLIPFGGVGLIRYATNWIKLRLEEEKDRSPLMHASARRKPKRRK